MWILLLIFALSAWADDDFSSERYCFPSTQASLAAKQKFIGIQVPSDTVTPDDKCLTIQMRPHRRELIQRFFLSTIPGTVVSFSSVDVKRDPCILNVEKVKRKIKENLEADLSTISISQTESNQTATENMEIQTLKDFELTVDQDQIKGTCKYINADRYQIKLEVAKNPRPLIPAPLPPGTIVVVNEPPKDQETMKLQTELEIKRGDRVEIGSVIKNLRDKSHEVSIDPSAKIDTGFQNSSELIYLSLK